MAEDYIEEVKQNWKEPKYLGTVFMLLLVVWFFYLNESTSPVPNLVEQNETSGVVTLLYDPNSYAPPTFVVFGQAVFGSALAVMLFFQVVRSQKRWGEEMVLEPEAVEIVTEKVGKDQESKRVPDGAVRVHTSFLRFKIDREKYKWNNWVVGITVIGDNFSESYFKYRLEPYSGAIIGNAIEMDEPLSDKDQCSSCGKESNIKVIRAEDLQLISKYGAEYDKVRAK